MDELIGRFVGDSGLDRAAAESAVGIVIDVPAEDGASGRLHPFPAGFSAADIVMRDAASEGSAAMRPTAGFAGCALAWFA